MARLLIAGKSSSSLELVPVVATNDETALSRFETIGRESCLLSLRQEFIFAGEA
jgi:hypothetical protein